MVSATTDEMTMVAFDTRKTGAITWLTHRREAVWLLQGERLDVHRPPSYGGPALPLSLRSRTVRRAHLSAIAAELELTWKPRVSTKFVCRSDSSRPFRHHYCTARADPTILLASVSRLQLRAVRAFRQEVRLAVADQAPSVHMLVAAESCRPCARGAPRVPPPSECAAGVCAAQPAVVQDASDDARCEDALARAEVHSRELPHC